MYTNILALLALDEESPRVLTRAHQMAQQHGAQLRALHVVEYVPLAGTEDAMLTAPIDLGSELEERARERMTKLARETRLDPASCRVTVGELATEVCQAIAEHGVDLVVVGNHSRRGLAAIFNHAQDEVLHRCACDLLAVCLD